MHHLTLRVNIVVVAAVLPVQVVWSRGAEERVEDARFGFYWRVVGGRDADPVDAGFSRGDVRAVFGGDFVDFACGSVGGEGLTEDGVFDVQESHAFAWSETEEIRIRGVFAEIVAVDVNRLGERNFVRALFLYL